MIHLKNLINESASSFTLGFLNSVTLDLPQQHTWPQSVLMLKLLMLLAAQGQWQKPFDFAGFQQLLPALSLQQLLDQISEQSPESQWQVERRKNYSQ